MKRILFSLVALLGITSAFAQDLTQATDTYNNGANAFVEKNYVSALQQFQEALKLGEACGDDAAELLENCRKNIANCNLLISSDLYNDAKYDEAIASLKEAIVAGEACGADEIVEKAKERIPQFLSKKAADLLNAKDFAAAVDAFKEALDADPQNGVTALRLGMALSGAGQTDEAIEVFKKAAAMGQDKTAGKQLSNIFLKKASASLKAKNLEDAIDNALQSAEYAESANAYKIAGTAANALQRKDEAVKYLSKYLELAPSAADAAQIKAAVEILKK